MQTNITVTDDLVILVLQGRFDWSAQNEFRDAIDAAVQDIATKEVQVDLGSVEYIDSTALGMLLVLRDEARAHNKRVSLVNCRNNVKTVLDIANFSKIFPIS